MPPRSTLAGPRVHEETLQEQLRKPPPLWVLISIVVFGLMTSGLLAVILQLAQVKLENGSASARNSSQPFNAHTESSFAVPAYGSVATLPSKRYQAWFPRTPEPLELAIPLVSIGVRGLTTPPGEVSSFAVFEYGHGGLMSADEVYASANRTAEKKIIEYGGGSFQKRDLVLHGFPATERTASAVRDGRDVELKMVVVNDGTTSFLFLLVYPPESATEAALILDSFRPANTGVR